MRSGTKVGCNEFEASVGRLRVVGRVGVGIDSVNLAAATEHGILVVILPFPIIVTATNIVPILLGVGALIVSERGQRLGHRISPVTIGGAEGVGGKVEGPIVVLLVRGRGDYGARGFHS
ncbi:hypothetical protein GUJ93_ZPchr0009g1090 [Zizania palustris]|uniref:D-isomer specific 2-hydroxyacid dehydrogenase catalytic domain-containing protein n=1 Tax=Zizania palustris TaxID=103762 RepID=A0A8J5RLM7_ZIZPA|nr:hypothetical protein GUJ93_ZPchr0009g1090 [Zizania palustris]